MCAGMCNDGDDEERERQSKRTQESKRASERDTTRLRDDDDVPVELADALVDTATPRLRDDVDEHLMLLRLRRTLTDADFRRIFDASHRRIGEF
ncbi:unnamed protein product [Agarophyton chilense]